MRDIQNEIVTRKCGEDTIDLCNGGLGSLGMNSCNATLTKETGEAIVPDDDSNATPDIKKKLKRSIKLSLHVYVMLNKCSTKPANTLSID